MKRILIVEDDNDILELLKIVFRGSAYDVVFSSIAPENDEIKILRPDLILLDVRLKGAAKSGADICKELKASPDTRMFPVILLSGEYNLAQIASESNADMYLAKPYDMLSLFLKIEENLA
ncbi:response regulator [Dyadobacter sp. CY107]|uniref:response regulator n=1 Tax=Dyadobacter fanqingshengii TaxID=2906443 RepID=UPI001F4197E6|nr:response regulator [Dyadobacter fanqingshengii]MCF2502046.1 response regulator [Dyadobacter fanqingshengii]